jgi:hypothetical protein
MSYDGKKKKNILKTEMMTQYGWIATPLTNFSTNSVMQSAHEYAFFNIHERQLHDAIRSKIRGRSRQYIHCKRERSKSSSVIVKQ